MTIYKMTDLGHQKIEVGDEDNAVLIAGRGAACTLVAGDGDNVSLQLGTGSHQLAVLGNGHNCTISGGGALSTMTGGHGGVLYQASSHADVTIECGNGNDTIEVRNDVGADLTIEGGGGTNILKFTEHPQNMVIITRASDHSIDHVTLTDIARTVHTKHVQVIQFSDGHKVS